MKKFTALLLITLMICTTACAQLPAATGAVETAQSSAKAEADTAEQDTAEAEEEAASAAEEASPAEQETAAAEDASPAEQETDATAEESAADEEELVLVQVNTEGVGEIALSEDGGTPEYDEEYPVSSAFTHVPKGSVIGLSARGQYDYAFVKWTKNGEYYSGDADITAPVDEDAEFVAVFGVSSGYEGEPVSSIEEAETMADVLPLPYYSTSTTGKYFAYVFELGGTLYRAISYISEELSEELFAIEYDDPEYNAKFNALVAPLPIDRMDNLTAMIPSQEELDTYIGKTGGDLLDEGWEYSWYYLDEMEFGMYHGMFSYNVRFDGKIETDESGYADVDDEMIRPLKVLSVTYEGLGDPTADLEAELEE